MRQSRIRRSSRVVAAWLLAVSLLGLVHRPAADDLCLPYAGEEHDASRHAFTAATTPAHDHCAICHWQRFLRPTFNAVLLWTPVVCAGTRVQFADGLSPAGSLAAPLPARAPPVLL